MKNGKRPLPGTNRQRAEKSDASNVHHLQGNAGRPEFVALAIENGVVPCGTYYVRLCDGLAERLEDLANRRGVLLEDLAAELIEDGLIRASLTESLLTSWEARS